MFNFGIIANLDPIVFYITAVFYVWTFMFYFSHLFTTV